MEYTKAINETMSQLADPGGKFCTADEVGNWIQYYVKEFARLTKICVSTATYTWAADTSEVALTTVITDTTHKYPTVDKAEWTYNTTSGSRLLIVSKDEAWFLDDIRHASPITGVPSRLYYDVHQDKIGLSPTPSSAGSLKAYYSYMPADYAIITDTFPAVMEPYYLGICSGAAAQGKMKDKERYSATNVQQSMDQFYRAVSQAKHERAKKTMVGMVGFVRDYPRW